MTFLYSIKNDELIFIRRLYDFIKPLFYGIMSLSLSLLVRSGLCLGSRFCLRVSFLSYLYVRRFRVTLKLVTIIPNSQQDEEGGWRDLITVQARW